MARDNRLCSDGIALPLSAGAVVVVVVVVEMGRCCIPCMGSSKLEYTIVAWRKCRDFTTPVSKAFFC